MNWIHRFLTAMSPSKTHIDYIDTFCYAESVGSKISLIQRNGWQYQKMDDTTFFMDCFQSPPKTGKKIRVLFTAGIHGDEPAGAEALLQFMLEHTPAEFADIDLTIIPCLNQWGLENGKRRNYSNLDLNRSFTGVSPKEITLYKSFLKDKKFHYYIDLHEDYRFDKPYIYNGLFHHKAFAKKLINLLAVISPLQKRKRVFSHNSWWGAVSIPYIARILIKFLPVGNSLYLLQRHALNGIVLETGRKDSIEKRVFFAKNSLLLFLEHCENFTVSLCSFRNLIWVFCRSIVERLDFLNLRMKDINVLYYGSKPVGFIRIKRFDDFTEIGNLFILKKFRHLGGFTILLSKTFESIDFQKLYTISRTQIRTVLENYHFKRAEKAIPQTLQKRFRTALFWGKVFSNSYELLVRENIKEWNGMGKNQ